MTLYAASFGGGLPAGLDPSTFSPNFFKTTKPLWAEAFDGCAAVAGMGLTIGVGGTAAVVKFKGVDHDPYGLDIGGLQVGVSGGLSAGLYYASTYMKHARENHGCVISPQGDPLCGGSPSPGPNSSPDIEDR